MENNKHVELAMDINCKTSTATTNLVGDLPGHGTIWLHPKGITNLMTLSYVIFNSEEGNHLIFEYNLGAKSVFEQPINGLYNQDTVEAISVELFVYIVEAVHDNIYKYYTSTNQMLY